MHEPSAGLRFPGFPGSNVFCAFLKLLPSKLLLQKMRVSIGCILGVVATSLFAIPAFADSQARIVRLSELEGDILVDRAIGQGFEKAVMNLPITQGAKLQAGYDGFAEIEFEDGSTVRIVPGTVIEVPVLVLRGSGARATTVNVLGGTAYINYEGTKDDEFMLTFGDEKLPLVKSGHIRLEVGGGKARLSVLGGASVQVEGPSGTVDVEKKRAVTFAMDAQTPPSPATGLTKITYDAWDQRQYQYHERYAKNGKYRNSPYAFGMSDLNYFGSFVNAPVCGLVWRPYFASASWDPFSSGYWVWYPNSGYSWVSSYPWGWTPYHFGSWQMCPNYGWAWQPGGTWAGVDNIPKPTGSPRVIRPPQPPPQPGHRTRPVERTLFSTSDLTPAKRLVIRNDSAGLGIPRGSIPDLHAISREVERHGPINAVVYAVPGGAHEVHIGATNQEATATSRRSPGSLTAPENSGSRSGTANPSSAGPRPSSGTAGAGAVGSHPSGGATYSPPSSPSGAGSAPRTGGAQTIPK